MSEELCPICHSPGFISPGPCLFCGHAERFPIRLTAEDGQSRAFNIEKICTMSWAAGLFGEEARYWDKKEQFRITPAEDGWELVPNPDAPNDTILIESAITTAQALNEGDRISVGRASKSVFKTLLTVSFDQ